VQRDLDDLQRSTGHRLHRVAESRGDEAAGGGQRSRARTMRAPEDQRTGRGASDTPCESRFTPPRIAFRRGGKAKNGRAREREEPVVIQNIVLLKWKPEHHRTKQITLRRRAQVLVTRRERRAGNAGSQTGPGRTRITQVIVGLTDDGPQRHLGQPPGSVYLADVLGRSRRSGSRSITRMIPPRSPAGETDPLGVEGTRASAAPRRQRCVGETHPDS